MGSASRAPAAHSSIIRPVLSQETQGLDQVEIPNTQKQSPELLSSIDRLMIMRSTPFLLILICALTAGCAPTETSSGDSGPQSTSPASEENLTSLPTESVNDVIVELVVRDLALRLSVGLNEIAVSSIERVEWPTSALGCPLPSADYIQVITPGYRINLEAAGEVYTYHTDTGMTLVLCQDGFPQLPTIPVIPGEIQDGEPWMPVDPIPTVAEGDTIADPDPVR